MAAAVPYTVDGAGPSRPPIDFSAALSTWRDINFVDLQQQLNTTAPELLEAQKAAVANRKKLADQTREFKKQPDANKPDSFKPLLKAYQTEIDTLTKRSKAAENAFLNVHSALTSAPDPYPLLEVILEQAASLNDLESLKHDNAKLHDDLAQTAGLVEASKENQAENARLQQRMLSLEQDFEAKLQQRTAALELELSAKWDERIRNLKERETDLTKSLNLAQEQLKHFKSKDETATAKLLEKGLEDEQHQDRNANGSFAEVELLSRDLERAHARVETVERRNEQLRVEIEGVKSGRQESEKLQILQDESREKDRKLQQLQSSLESERLQSASLTKQLASARDEKVKLQSEKDAEIELLRAKLHQRSDYADIKRELEIVKAVHFNAEDDDDFDPSVAANGNTEHDATKPRSTDAKSLEALLLEKNKRLDDNLATLRVSNAELTASLDKINGKLTSLEQERSHLKALNDKLEIDLASVGTGDRSTAKRSATMSAEEALKEMESLEAQVTQAGQLGKRTAANHDGVNGAPVASPARSVPALASSRPSISSAAPSASAGGDSSILPIVTSQRDRFRTRNAELEDELRKQFETISELRNEIKTLQSDNLSLYEKVRYLQSYGPGTNASGSRGEAIIQIGGNGRDSDGAYPPPHRPDDKYRARYEESMNPFEAFRGREQSRAMAQLNPLERALHILTRLVLSHRRMRLFFMVYAIFLHLLIFVTLFEVGHTSSTQTCSLPPR
ncbi:golgi membrane protein [Pseudozyma hubeiensis SY62]|uniref:Protein CASP n=1 Tax=Pseudozyma hubeiensis (strain SY62) TaxID=1305764 RepID=R9P129_PSEHS|nr:golgi membrane protein [Pseudozyma hubeiensis SY62]GAC94973.1 golgi membrane protein [Pseudozyma hubeiensis SY62]